MLVAVPKTWLIAYFLSAATYCASIAALPYSFSPLIKVIPILLLFYLLQTKLTAGVRGWMSLAILFSAIGDVLLAITSVDLFVFGLGAFLVAHLFYIKVFWPISRSKLRHRQGIIAAYCIYAALIVSILAPNLGSLFLPVLLYMAILMAMAITAVLFRKSNFLIVLGAASFVISDSIIGFNKFVNTIEFASYFIMISYYAAQFMIVVGVIRSENQYQG